MHNTHWEAKVTQESPPHISQLPTLKLRGPPDLPGKEFERYIAGKQKKISIQCQLYKDKELLHIIYTLKR